jgi:hypothetical protein
VRPRPTTRTVLVEASLRPNAGGAATTRSLECGPGQLLLVRRKIDEGQGRDATRALAAVAARRLRRDDELIVFGEGGRAFFSCPLVGVTERFHEPPVTTLTLENRRPLHTEMSRATLVNQGIAVVLSVPSMAELPVDFAPEAPSGSGGNSGNSPGPMIGTGRVVPDLDHGPSFNLRAGATDDIIHFSNDARTVLERFGVDLSARSEQIFNGKARQHGAAVPSKLLVYWETKFARWRLRWPHSTSDVVGTLRIWVKDLVQKRARFLKEPRSQALPPILLREMILASWLKAADAPELADMVLTDLVELAIFAGCEPDRELGRLGSQFGLALVLYAPGFVRGEKPARAAEPVSPAAQRLLRAWGDEEGGNLLNGGEVMLGQLYHQWRDKARPLGLIGQWWPTYWEPITVDDWGSNQTRAVSAAWKSFDDLISGQVRALVQELRAEGATP